MMVTFKYINVHTESCCKECGCKYGCDVPIRVTGEPRIVCCVVNGDQDQSFACGINDVCIEKAKTNV